jgi:ribonuclease Y
MTELIYFLVALAAGALLSYLFLLKSKLFDPKENELKAEKLLEEAKTEAKQIINKTKEDVQNRKKDFEHIFDKKEERHKNTEKSLKQKEDVLRKRQERHNQIKLKIASQREQVQVLESKIEQSAQKLTDKLLAKTKKSFTHIKEEIFKTYEQELKQLYQERTAKEEEYLKENAKKIAIKILHGVIQRVVFPTSVERRAVHVKVQKDFIKGKIVGKKGQNILALEKLLNVDIVFNDAPKTISMSAFNLVDRRTAQVTLKKLVEHRGDINPTVVEQKVEEAKKDVQKELYKIGKKTLANMTIKHENEEFLTTVGRLKYRTSYGQNVLLHCQEVGWVCQMLAAEIGADQRCALVAGFLHDVGKAIDQDPNQKDCHDFLSKEIMEKHGFSWEEVHAAWVHHDAEPQQTVEAILVKGADAVSAARPGARQESFEKYIQRIKDLEETAFSFAGVKKAYAISAGREVRVNVDEKRIDDKKIVELAKKMAGKIEQDVTYPGQVKVNVIRTTKYIKKIAKKS